MSGSRLAAFTTGVIVRLVSSALSTVGESWSDVLDRLTTCSCIGIMMLVGMRVGEVQLK
jgi:hypothetical protein